MKRKLFLLTPMIFFATFLFAQVKAIKPLTAKEAVTTPATNTKPLTNPRRAKTENPPPRPTDLQNAIVNIIVGNDGKDDDTRLRILINDENKRLAAYFGAKNNKSVIECASTKGAYFPGDDETIPTEMEAGVPTGEIDQKSGYPIPVMREANLSDFNNGGSVDIAIATVGHDTWNIKSFSVTLYFNNDPGTPHKITWNGFTLSQDGGYKHLEFDKNFNPIQ